MLNLIIFISLTITIIAHNERKSFKELVDIYLNKLDINDAFLSYNKYISLLQSLKNDFPDYLELSSIGKTYENNDMPLIIMKSPINNIHDGQQNIINSTEEKSANINNTNIYKTNNNSNNSNETYLIDNSLYNKSAIFFDGMHHGCEPVSMMMNIYLILHLLSLPKVYLHLFLSSTNIYFVPIVNIDTYKYNSDKYFLTNSTNDLRTRKNRRPHKEKNCSEKYIGVDLNRNYDFFFGNYTGSSSDPCDLEYRGEYPFSEPETKNIKDFVEMHPDIKIAIDYHSWGNIIITPFNCLKSNESEKKLENEFPQHYKMYQDFKKEAKFPKNFTFGNADKTIKYMTNGEGTDWFLGKKHILSFSPELGNGNKDSYVFYPNRNITFDILDKNLYSGLYAIQKSMFFLKSELIKAEYSQCGYKNAYNDIVVTNKRSVYDNNNLRDIELRNCFSDEVLINAKIKITNHGYGTYIPGIEFNYNLLNNLNNTNTENESNKKYFYFLAFDLKVYLDNIKSICYWSSFENITGNLDKIDKNANKTKINEKEIEVRCATNKGDELNDMKLFIDKEIKYTESIIVTIQIIAKKESFIEKQKYKKSNNTQRILENIENITNVNKTKENETDDLIKLYTKRERLIKSEKINGEIIEWKFNDPSITIKIGDFIKTKSHKLILIKNFTFRFLSYLTTSIAIMIFFICRIVLILNARENNNNHYNNRQVNEGRALNRNYNMNDRHIVHNYENQNQFQNIDDNEYSNSDSP